MRYNPLPAAFFQRNRQRLIERLPAKSAVILRSNDIMPTNADGTMPFRQNSDLYYLTGIDQEETVLVVAPDHPNPDMREILFLKETNQHIAIWEGQKLTKDQGTTLSGISRVRWVSSLEDTLPVILGECEAIYLNSNEHHRSDHPVRTGHDLLIANTKEQYPLHRFDRLAPHLASLRSVKSSEEIDALQAACDITAHGFRALLKTIEPGMYEYELEALLSHEFLKRGSRGFAYHPIVAGGANACILHYIENDRLLQSGDLVLLDVGAEYANYNADLTRTIPVSGRYSPRQREVYDAVLRVKKEATDLLRPGNNLQDYQKEVGKIMSAELVGLGLITREEVTHEDPERPAFKKYFMHGTSHHLGLDVHDVPSRHEVFQPGMVLTVEPGIYIPEEKLGVRIEDDVVITEGLPKNLMGNIPIEAEEIEALINDR